MTSPESKTQTAFKTIKRIYGYLDLFPSIDERALELHNGVTLCIRPISTQNVPAEDKLPAYLVYLMRSRHDYNFSLNENGLTKFADGEHALTLAQYLDKNRDNKGIMLNHDFRYAAVHLANWVTDIHTQGRLLPCPVMFTSIPKH